MTEICSAVMASMSSRRRSTKSKFLFPMGNSLSRSPLQYPWHLLAIKQIQAALPIQLERDFSYLNWTGGAAYNRNAAVEWLHRRYERRACTFMGAGSASWSSSTLKTVGPTWAAPCAWQPNAPYIAVRRPRWATTSRICPCTSGPGVQYLGQHTHGCHVRIAEFFMVPVQADLSHQHLPCDPPDEYPIRLRGSIGAYIEYSK